MNRSCLYQNMCQRDFWTLEQGLHKGTLSWPWQDSPHHPKRDVNVDSDKPHRRIHVHKLRQPPRDCDARGCRLCLRVNHCCPVVTCRSLTSANPKICLTGMTKRCGRKHTALVPDLWTSSATITIQFNAHSLTMAMIGSLIDKLDNWSTVIHVEIQLYLATKEFINKTSKFKRVIFIND